MRVSIEEVKQNLEVLLHKAAAREIVVITLENPEFEIKS